MLPGRSPNHAWRSRFDVFSLARRCQTEWGACRFLAPLPTLIRPLQLFLPAASCPATPPPLVGSGDSDTTRQCGQRGEHAADVGVGCSEEGNNGQLYARQCRDREGSAANPLPSSSSSPRSSLLGVGPPWERRRQDGWTSTPRENREATKGATPKFRRGTTCGVPRRF